LNLFTFPLFGNLNLNEGVDGKLQASASTLKLSYPQDLPVSLQRIKKALES
jgi:hypothetical protein